MSNRPFLLVFACFLCAAGPVARPEVTLCADVWCPYNCGPGSAQPGFAVEILQDVFHDAGYDVTYEASAWARCIEDARAGRYTAIIGAIHADAPDFVFPQLPIGDSAVAYAVRKGDPFRYTGTQAFEGRVIAAVRSYSFNGETGAYLAAHANDGKRVEFVAGDDALQKNLGKLVAGRVDLVLDDANVLQSKIAALGLEDKVVVVHGPRATPLYIAFSPALPDSRSLAAILDRGMQRLRQNGALGAIMARYHVRLGS